MQEVGGSSPPVPTTLQAAERGLNFELRTSNLGMDHISVTLPDGSVKSAARGTTVRDFAASSLPSSVVKKALAATVDGKLVDLTFPIERDATLKLMLPDGADAL